MSTENDFSLRSTAITGQKYTPEVILQSQGLRNLSTLTDFVPSFFPIELREPKEISASSELGESRKKNLFALPSVQNHLRSSRTSTKVELFPALNRARKG